MTIEKLFTCTIIMAYFCPPDHEYSKEFDGIFTTLISKANNNHLVKHFCPLIDLYKNKSAQVAAMSFIGKT